MSTDMGYEAPEPAVLTAAQRRKSGVVRAIILSGWIMTLATMMAIVGASLWLTLTGKIVPETLGNWTGVALGFLFGNFSSIVANYIKEEQDSG